MSTPVIPVKPGQVWRDCDKRMGERYLVVRRFGSATFENHVYCERCDREGRPVDGKRREVRISIARMRPTATGYEYIRESRA